MNARIVDLAGRVTSVALLVGVLGSFGCSADLHPFHDCDPGGSRCDGEAAVNCQVESANPFMERYVEVRATCSEPERCRVAGGVARCVVNEAPCTPGSPRRCEGNDVVACTPLAPNGAAGLELVVSRCQHGNVCVQGDCVAPADEACDPASFTLACREGRPLLCNALEGARAGQHRVVFAEDACADGNRCIDAEGFVACGVSETPCDGAFRSRCDGDAVVRCTASYPRAGRGWTGVERRFPCPHGCADAATGGDCAAAAP